MSNNDAVDERKLILCCALCCANISFLPSCGALGCSGKVRTSSFVVASFPTPTNDQQGKVSQIFSLAQTRIYPLSVLSLSSSTLNIRSKNRMLMYIYIYDIGWRLLPESGMLLQTRRTIIDAVRFSGVQTRM
jgi:hypothetical protein